MRNTTFICTDVSKDGKLQGPALATYRTLQQAFPHAQLIASGGVTTLADVAALAEIGMQGYTKPADCTGLTGSYDSWRDEDVVSSCTWTKRAG